MRVLGAGASVLLVGALIMAGIGLFCGPNTPFSVFSAQDAHGHRDKDAGKQSDRRATPGPGGTVGSSVPGGRRTSLGVSPSPSHSSAPSAKASRTPSPTNRAGRTPPG